MSIETIKLMLDALENHTAIKHPQQAYYRDRALEAGRQAIADAEKQEPAAWMWTLDGKVWDLSSVKDRYQPIRDGHVQTPLYTHPQPKREPLTLEQRKAIQDEQEWPQMCDPYMYWFFKGVDAAEAAHGIHGVDKTAKQRHKWVGLTDDEVEELWERTGDYGSFYLAVEAKLKEKNT